MAKTYYKKERRVKKRRERVRDRRRSRGGSLGEKKGNKATCKRVLILVLDGERGLLFYCCLVLSLFWLA